MFLVTGATGELGRRIVRQLCTEKQPVRSFVRLMSDYAELEHRGSEIFIGDLCRDRDIQKAMQGIQTVISAHGGAGEPANYRANIDLIDAAKQNGVQHFVFISVLGVDRGYQDAPVFKAKREVERYLEKSGLSYTILRPAGFASNLLPLAEQFRQTGTYLLVGDPRNRTSIVSPDDVARMAIASPTAAPNQIVAVGGPEILQRQEVPRIFGRIFNREPIVINPPLFAFEGVRSLVGLISPQVRRSLGTLQTLLGNEFYLTPQELERLEALYGFQPESLETFLRRYLST
jgi:uncharacterized protein YbjT (DUF2867 family)